MKAEETNNPVVSVIIPTHNRAHLVTRAVKSVLNQTYGDFEVIIVDDGSKDNTREVVEELQKQDSRIRYVKLENNMGGAAARNAGIKASRGAYIAFQDSDDEWLPEKLKKQMDVFETASYKTGVVYTGFWREENHKRSYVPFSWIRQKEGNIFSELLKGNYIGTPAVVARKECFDKAGMFDESLPRYQDWDLWIRIAKYFHFRYIHEPLVLSYHMPASISADNNALIRALENISEKYSADIGQNRKLLAEFYLTIGHLLSSHDEFKKGRDYLLKAVKEDPFNARALLIAFLSFFGRHAYNGVLNMYRKMRSSRNAGGTYQ